MSLRSVRVPCSGRGCAHGWVWGGGWVTGRPRGAFTCRRDSAPCCSVCPVAGTRVRSRHWPRSCPGSPTRRKTPAARNKRGLRGFRGHLFSFSLPIYSLVNVWMSSWAATWVHFFFVLFRKYQAHFLKMPIQIDLSRLVNPARPRQQATHVESTKSWYTFVRKFAF